MDYTMIFLYLVSIKSPNLELHNLPIMMGAFAWLTQNFLEWKEHEKGYYCRNRITPIPSLKWDNTRNQRAMTLKNQFYRGSSSVHHVLLFTIKTRCVPLISLNTACRRKFLVQKPVFLACKNSNAYFVLQNIYYIFYIYIDRERNLASNQGII